MYSRMGFPGPGRYRESKFFLLIADVMKLVDMPDLGSGAARHGGSSPFIRTYNIMWQCVNMAT